VIGERGILKKERTADRKTIKQQSEKMDDKDADMECGTVWSVVGLLFGSLSWPTRSDVEGLFHLCT